jgi:hypothetical protein
MEQGTEGSDALMMELSAASGMEHVCAWITAMQ